MRKDVQVPEVSENVTEGTVVNIMVSEGDRIERDQSILELETEKAVVPIPSPYGGRVAQIRVQVGDTVHVGDVIIVVETEEAQREQAPPTRVPAPRAEEPSRREARPREVEAPPDAAEEAYEAPSQVAPASPSLRRQARKLGLPIHQVQGTGPGGRITEEDLTSYARRTIQGARREGPVPVEMPDLSRFGPVHTQALNKVKEVTAATMARAWSTIPQVTHNDRADITDLEEFRRSYNRRQERSKLTMTAILVKVSAEALRTFPQFNAALDLERKELVMRDYIHVAVAVDTDRGLLVPVIRDADKKGIEKLASELGDLAARARDKRIRPEEMEGGGFTISNLGGIGGTSFSPIVYPPQLAILGVSRASTEAMVFQGQIQPRLILPLSLTYDHRAIDGAEAARFLRWVVEALEHPWLLMMKE